MKKLEAGLLVLLCGTVLVGCSSPSTGSSSVYYSSGYYDPWWYGHDDYWIYYYPGCCDIGHDHREKLEVWWNGLDDDQQQSIKDKVEDWKDGDMNANFDNMKRQLDNHWQTLPDEQKQAIQAKWHERPQRVETKTLPKQTTLPESTLKTQPLPAHNVPRPITKPNIQRPQARPNIQPVPRIRRR
ncbi:TPA: hypothetical protein ACVU5O_002478 [Vibrio parahaemolyticus]